MAEFQFIVDGELVAFDKYEDIPENFEHVTKFFETMPKLVHVIEVKNPKTKKKSEIPIEGLQSFFE